jgi:hypothetical protein
MAQVPALTKAYSRYGASMGRSDVHDDGSKSRPVAFLLIRLRWVDGDYDDGGAYWGATKGEHIYRAYCPDGVDNQIDIYKRAASFQDAQRQVAQDYPLATFAYAEDTSEKKYWFSGNYGVEFEMTLEQAESASHAGDCEADVQALQADPVIAEQLAKIKPEALRRELEDYGTWDAEELSDHNQNLTRILWLAAGDIRDSHASQDDDETDLQEQP